MPSLLDSGKLTASSNSVRGVAQKCGLHFPLSLRTFISSKCSPFKHRIRLHLKILQTPSIAEGIMLRNMRQVYATADIRVEVGSRETFTAGNLSNFTNLLDLDVNCDADNPGTSTEQDDLFGNRNNAGANDIVVYFVRTTIPALNGCGRHPVNQPGAAITQFPSAWTLAHEVGHVLRLKHITGEDSGGKCKSADFTRLMTGCSTSKISGIPTLDNNERTTMQSSGLVALDGD